MPSLVVSNRGFKKPIEFIKIIVKNGLKKLNKTNLDVEVAGLDNELGFEVFKLSDSMNNEHPLQTLAHKTSKLDMYLTVFVISGNGKVLIDFEEYDIESGSFIFATRGQLFKTIQINNLDAIVFKLNEDFLTELFDGRGILPFARLFSYHHLSPLISFSQNQYQPLVVKAEEIYCEYGYQDQYGHKQVLQLLLKLMMYQLVRQRERRLIDTQPPRSIKLFSHFNRLVIENFKEVKSAHDYARMLKVSYKTLNQVCKANINRTAKAYIEYVTVLEIKRLLAYSSKSVQEVAFYFGFEEPTNMVKFFKKHTNMTPTQFRNETN